MPGSAGGGGMRRRIAHLEVVAEAAAIGEWRLSAEQVAWACRRIRRLEAALAAARRAHADRKPLLVHGHQDAPCEGSPCPAAKPHPDRTTGCTCGAKTHNAAIDAALVEES